ncbi:polyamine transporter [Aspergillus sclerotiicarbonarius CBS 121057]|uniref:Polyamine transporter n=1 Tax=Aspergillus sclerotiicarbonarius (strain CBS 121057 / IBT 28362) TaxID=1448318 RepID=A0A319E2M5_ASPSB|nr:polyamine transporter [Aspergillus sclerotiicarbonarius CBS 121057]
MLKADEPQAAVGGLKTTSDGLVLDPQPSDNPNDPLNWEPSKKNLTLAIWALACFICQATCLTNTQGSYVQVPLYHKTATQISLSVSFALVGLMVGAIFIIPFSRRYGSCFCLFWSNIGQILTSVWSALMTAPSDYTPFLISRLVSGLCASVPLILGSEVVLQIFFRHQRGKCAYIDGRTSWTISFWYTVPLNGVLAVLILALLEDTYFTEEEQTQGSLLQRRWNTYARGRAIPPSSRISWVKFISILFDILLVTFSPVSVIIGFFIMVDFGFATMAFVLNVTFLEAPRDQGGYGMSKMAVASFTLTQTIGVLLVEVYGHFISDRLPLYLVRRKFRTHEIEPTDWRPEYRLHCLWFPVILLPIGLGLFGASLEFHFHWAVLALGYLLISVGAISTLPITMTYLCECFPHHISEVAAALGIWRLILGLLTTVFIAAWDKSFGPGWVFGSSGLFTIPAFGGVVVLMVFGRQIRGMGFRRLRR